MRTARVANSGSRQWIEYSTSLVLPGDTESKDVDSGVFTLLNDLGREGWELIDRTVQVTAIAGRTEGWLETVFPVRELWILKRPVA